MDILANEETMEVELFPRGEQGIGVQSIEQTSTSTEDEGINVVTATLTDGRTSTFEIRNGSKGSQGIQGEQGIQGIQGIQGEPGVGVSSIEQTSTSHEDEGINVITATLTNGNTSTFNVTNGSKGSKGDTGYSPTVTTSKQGKVTTITITDLNGTHTAEIRDGADGQGSGDMLKATYDTNDNGIVDNAEKVNNHTVLSDVPANAVFTDTTYSDVSEFNNDAQYQTYNNVVQALTPYSLITETGNKIELSIDSSTYVLTATLKDKNNNIISTSAGIDLPLETMVVGASYDSLTQEIVLTLKNGTTTRFSVSALVSGLENTSNKVTSISSSSTNTQYPSAKAVYDYISSLDASEVSY